METLELEIRKNVKLLSKSSIKTLKGEKFGYETYILYMSPFTNNSKGINICPHATSGCASVCLFGSGNARFKIVTRGRRNKTEWFLSNREEFLLKIDKEISSIIRNHKNENKLAFRLNGTSDLPYEKFKVRDNKNIFELYPNVQFYDYTKNPIRMLKELPSNYHLTFSMSETNFDDSIMMLKLGKNVAMVFEKELPETFNGFKVINGDESDLTFTYESGVIVGLKYKKMTGLGSEILNKLALTNGFVITKKCGSIV